MTLLNDRLDKRSMSFYGSDLSRPEVCFNTRSKIDSDVVYYHISVPQRWITSHPGSFGRWKLIFALEEFYSVVGMTTKKNSEYPYDWAWVMTRIKGAHFLLQKLGYTVYEIIPDGVDARSLAKFHGLDVRFIEVETDSYTLGPIAEQYMCFRNEDDAVLMRLAM